jgi:hypothetical protein
MMKITEIVKGSHDKHTGVQQFGLMSQTARATGEPSQALAEGGIEPFNEGGVNHAAALTGVQQTVNQSLRPLHNPPTKVKGMAGTVLHHLNNHNVWPLDQGGSSWPTPPPWQRGAERTFERPRIARQSIHRQQQRTTQGARPNLVRQVLNQAFITSWTNDTPDPEASRYHDGQCHPDHATPNFHPNLIGLYLHQIQFALTDHMGVNRFTVDTRTLPPAFDRPFIKAIRRYDRRDRTAIRQQHQHQHHQLGGGPQAIKDRPVTRREGFVTLIATIPPFCLTMDMNVPRTDFPSCGTRQLGAKYLSWVHLASSFDCLIKESLPVNPFFFNFRYPSRLLVPIPDCLYETGLARN